MKSDSVRYSLGFIVFLILSFTCTASFCQVRPENRVGTPAGTIPVKNDTASSIAADTIVQKADSIKQDSIPPTPKKGDIETTINYNAKDSMNVSIHDKIIWLYGDSKITYGSIEVTGDEIIIDYANNTVTAQNNRDSTGQAIGYPTFKNGNEFYETKGMTYNIKTKRARIKEIVTQQGEGFLQSAMAFKNEKNEIFSIDNSYTTCNLEHPHFRIRATKTKAIPHDKIVAGPFYLEFNDIPLPAGFLFGMFPAQRESKSGIIFPSYGEERRRGFNFRGGGYFFDISDYVKLALTGDIYSKGSHALYANSTYTKRYAYNGSFNFSYTKNLPGTTIEDRSEQNDFRLAWTHSPQSKGTGRFSASVNAATSNFNKNNSLINSNLNPANSKLSNTTSQLSSNISYNKKFAGTPFSMGINLSHNQNLVSGLVDLPLPNVTVNMTNQYPFQRKGKTSVLDNFMFGYSMAGTNRITNQIRPDSIAIFNLDNLPTFLRNSRKGVKFTVPVSYSFKALKYFTISPSFQYNGRIYFEKIRYRYTVPSQSNSASAMTIDTIKQVNEVGDYSFSTSMTTRVYGMYFIKNPNSKVKAIRHVINPSIGVSLVPDFTKNENYYQLLRKPQNPILPSRIVGGNAASTQITQPTAAIAADEKALYYYQSLYSGPGFVYGGAPTGKAAALTFGVGNNLEMKVKGAKDTIDRKVMLLNNFSISSNYNFIADSFKLANFALAANTSILNNLININASGTLDPYNYFRGYGDDGVTRLKEVRQRELAFKAGKPGRITQAQLALSTNLNPKMRSKEQQTREKVAKSDIPESDKQHIIQNPDAYVDFDIPWSANINYNLGYTHSLNNKTRFTQTVTVSGDVSISEKWKINYSSGYDFKAKDFTQTSFAVSRDLHCWTMNLSWVPFGRYQQYNFTIAVKASVLQDLKLERRKPFLDNL